MAKGGTLPPFGWMARVHAGSTAGDALVAIGLAGSLFFSISPDAARGRVSLYLLLTMAPFAVVAPLIGPLLDRHQGGRRTVVVASLAGRSLLCLLMADDIDNVLLFPEAFGVLVLGKGYGIAKASIVPAVVNDADGLVRANSKLTLVSGLSGFVAALPGLLLFQVGASYVLVLASLVFFVATLVALRLPRMRPAPPESAVGRAEVRSGHILLAAGAMAVLRGAVGFLAFLLAFSLRAEDAPTWWFGIVLAVSAVGALAGAVIAPPLRRVIREEQILVGCLLLVVVSGLLAVQIGGRLSGVVLAAGVGAAASAGRLCFDSIVQRDAPDADKGRTFARFEARFQLVWVASALVAVVVPFRRDVGFGLLTIVATVALLSYLTGRQPWRLRRPPG